MLRMISVAPMGDGWRVSVEGLANDMVFRSGRQAEAAARRLAARLAGAGRPTEVRVHLRDNSLAGRFLCPPAFTPPRIANDAAAGAPAAGREAA